MLHLGVFQLHLAGWTETFVSRKVHLSTVIVRLTLGFTAREGPLRTERWKKSPKMAWRYARRRQGDRPIKCQEVGVAPRIGGNYKKRFR